MPINFYGNKGPNGYLSNFYLGIFTIKGIQYQTNEHWYQSMKSEDPEVQFKIRSAPGPGTAKRWGGQIECREDWEELVGTPTLRAMYQDARGDIVERTKDFYMFWGLTQKFTQLRDIRARLLGTGDEELVEYSKEPYWGNALDGSGLNKLGRMLMAIRAKERTQE